MTEVNRKDYRAWYGLGQAYELLSMHQYALYYYQHATALRYVLRSSRYVKEACFIALRSIHILSLGYAKVDSPTFSIQFKHDVLLIFHFSPFAVQCLKTYVASLSFHIYSINQNPLSQPETKETGERILKGDMSAKEYFEQKHE